MNRPTTSTKVIYLFLTCYDIINFMIKPCGIIDLIRGFSLLIVFLVSYIAAIQDDAESIHQLLVLLSDTSIEVKQNALTDLMKLARESSPSLWENQFKDILMSVVEKMKDPEVHLIDQFVRIIVSFL